MMKVCILFVFYIVLSGFSARASGRPNVLFLAVDDMKDWVGCLGGYEGTVHTPNIDRLAKRGVLFTNAHCPSPKCGPSRAAVMTGLMPSTTGLYENGQWLRPNLPEVVTMPAHFRRSGYRVVGAGKLFHHTAGNNPPDQWDDFLRLTFRNDPWFRDVKLNYPWSESGPYPDEFPFSGVEGLGHENDWGSLGIPEADYDDSLSTDYAIRFLSDWQGESPFFLACGIFRPHLPWYVPQKYFDLYPLDQVVLPRVKESDLDDVPKPGKALAKDRRQDWETIHEAGKWEEAVRAYLASISYADAQLGRVLDAVDSSSFRQDTIIVLWSDHGWHLGEKDHWHKTTLWEEATRVPFIVSAPKRAKGVCSRPVNLIDAFPTLIDLCGLPEMDTLDGRSLVPLLENPDAEWEHPSVIEYRVGNVAVRDERYRYIRYRDGSEELYDHRTDPYEWTNIARDEKALPVISRLSQYVTKKWADSLPGKKAFSFDPATYSWTENATGRTVSGTSEAKKD